MKKRAPRYRKEKKKLTWIRSPKRSLYGRMPYSLNRETGRACDRKGRATPAALMRGQVKSLAEFAQNVTVNKNKLTGIDHAGVVFFG